MSNRSTSSTLAARKGESCASLSRARGGGRQIGLHVLPRGGDCLLIAGVDRCLQILVVLPCRVRGEMRRLCVCGDTGVRAAVGLAHGLIEQSRGGTDAHAERAIVDERERRDSVGGGIA